MFVCDVVSESRRKNIERISNDDYDCQVMPSSAGLRKSGSRRPEDKNREGISNDD